MNRVAIFRLLIVYPPCKSRNGRKRFGLRGRSDSLKKPNKESNGSCCRPAKHACRGVHQQASEADISLDRVWALPLCTGITRSSRNGQSNVVGTRFEVLPEVGARPSMENSVEE